MWVKGYTIMVINKRIKIAKKKDIKKLKMHVHEMNKSSCKVLKKKDLELKVKYNQILSLIKRSIIPYYTERFYSKNLINKFLNFLSASVSFLGVR